MNYSKGISWIDDCRIPFTNETIVIKSYENNVMDIWYDKNKKKRLPNKIKTEGRFPANLLCSDDVLNDGSISGGGKMKKTGYRVGGKSEISVGLNGKKDALDNYGDKGTNSRYYDIDKWFNNLIDELF